ncbi:hypothetical protein EVAR_39991_1 [Eumeta japonica]|uniref:Uncharacterized protein n=1 Tax=Eumeta variegata TaxID=151549 RepID=A0A4C1YJK4_EUMVA|nr:hypothetical protein EVAR_39991_1 [Eumeta japonica]
MKCQSPLAIVRDATSPYLSVKRAHVRSLTFQTRLEFEFDTCRTRCAVFRRGTRDCSLAEHLVVYSERPLKNIDPHFCFRGIKLHFHPPVSLSARGARDVYRHTTARHWSASLVRCAA